MIAPILRRVLLPSVMLALALTSSLAGRAPEGNDKSLFLSALDEAGKPVKDLTPDEIRIREDGTDREVTGLRPAAQMLYIELLADTTGGADELVRDFRVALMAFVRQVGSVNPNAEIALMEFGQAALTVTDFTKSPEELEKGINKLFPKPNAPSVLLEALVDASNNLLKKPSPRRGIVSVNLEPSDEKSREDAGKALNDSLRKSGAQIWSVSLQKGALKNPTRDVVLNTLTKNTGGDREFIVGPSALEAVLRKYADALVYQYELTYKRPGKSAKVVQVGTTRQGIKLHASGYPPQ